MLAGRRGRRCLVASAIAVCVLVANRASAAPPIIVVVAVTDQDPIASRLRAEVDALGFEARSVVSTDPPARAPLEATAQGVGAVAALRVVRSATGVEVWVVDRVTGKTLLRELPIEVADSEQAASIVAVRAVELLRASLLEVEFPNARRGDAESREVVLRLLPGADFSQPDALAPAPERAEPRPPPTPPPLPEAAPAPVDSGPASDPSRGGATFLGPGFLTSPGGVGNSLAAIVGHQRPLSDALAAGGWLAISVLAPEVTAPEGSSTVGVNLLGLGVDGRWRAAGAFSVSAGGGVLGLHMRLVGAANAPFRSTREDVFAVAPYARGAVTYALGDVVAARAEALGGVALPEPVIRFASREVASFGRPLVLASVGLELRAP